MQNEVPACIGIMLDGNRRWAKRNNLSKFEGHQRGLNNAFECARWVRDRGIKHLAYFVFSTENWNREPSEVNYLLNLVEQMTYKDGALARLIEENVRVRFMGKRELLADSTRKAIADAEEKSAQNTAMTLWVGVSYGGRAEIVAAVRDIAKTGEEITEESLAKHFWSAEMPDPDIIIRTGGVQRLSNFLLWQAAYSELFFIDTLWPDFSEEILDRILVEYGKRERRMGK